MKRNKFQRVIAITICSIVILLALCTIFYRYTNINDDEKAPVEKAPLRVLIDIDYGSNILKPNVEQELNRYIEIDGKTYSFMSRIKELGGPDLIEVEFPPMCGTEREIYLSRLRTELMAGEGPDVFVCMSGVSYVVENLNASKDNLLTGEWVFPIFSFPQQAMERRIFLNLEPHKEKFERVDWDKMTPVILDAGKYSGEQYILPMSYTMPVTLFNNSEVSHIPSVNTWSDMLEHRHELQIAAVMDSSIYLGNVFFPFIDTQKDKLAFSENELYDYITAKADTWKMIVENEPDSQFLTQLLGVGIDDTQQHKVSTSESFTMIPVYSLQGGYGVSINCFAAINANTKQVDNAVFILDYLLSEECQCSSLFSHICLGRGIPILEGLMTDSKPCVGYDGNAWSMSEDNYLEFCRLRDNIAFAEFSTPLALEIRQLFSDVKNCNDPNEIQQKVHETYMRMSMELAES